jgi:hypothetical protein
MWALRPRLIKTTNANLERTPATTVEERRFSAASKAGN